MDERKGDVNQSHNKENVVNIGDVLPSFEDEFNSTFIRLEAMQEEIMSKTIAKLEEQLSELEAFALKILNEA